MVFRYENSSKPSLWEFRVKDTFEHPVHSSFISTWAEFIKSWGNAMVPSQMENWQAEQNAKVKAKQ